MTKKGHQNFMRIKIKNLLEKVKLENWGKCIVASGYGRPCTQVDQFLSCIHIVKNRPCMNIIAGLLSTIDSILITLPNLY